MSPALPDTSNLYHLARGSTPVLVNVPHAGTLVPETIAVRLTPVAARLPDTDWFVDELYRFVTDLGAGLMVASHSRYVIDLNRPPGDEALYATRTTGLVPVETFAGECLYRPGEAPGPREVNERRKTYWRPYHAVLEHELGRLRETHGHAVLLDAHSIHSRVPALFAGRLPVLNLGSNDGTSAATGLVDRAVSVLRADARWDLAVDGRFKGGYITRHYGGPPARMHALQLEMAQRAYMDETSLHASEATMRDIRGLLRTLVQALIDWRSPDG